jgi:hypothetical protein
MMVGRYGRRVRRYVVLTLIASVLFIGPQPALACTCAPSSKARLGEAAAVVFTGVVAGISRPFDIRSACTVSSMDPVFVAFDVESVYKGEVGKRATVGTVVSGASCGATFEMAKRYTVFARRDGDALETNLCQGNADGAIVPSEYGLAAGRPPR